MNNQCHKCKSRNTVTVKAKDMADKTGNSSFITSAYGAIDPALAIGALTSIIKALRELFGWLNRKEKIMDVLWCVRTVDTGKEYEYENTSFLAANSECNT